MEYLDLVRKAQAGDAGAFGLIYDDFADKLFRFIRLKVQNQQQAEDVLQEVFLKAWRGLPNFKSEAGNFSAWIYKIAGNAINDHFRKLYSSPQEFELGQELDAAGDGTSADDVTLRTDLENVREAMQQLPVRYRQVLELRFVRDFTLQETAQILQTSNLAVRLVQHRALNKLRNELKQQYADSFSKIW